MFCLIAMLTPMISKETLEKRSSVSTRCDGGIKRSLDLLEPMMRDPLFPDILIVDQSTTPLLTE